MEPEDEEGLCAPEEPVVKKRRKKQKKVVLENFLPLPSETKAGYSPEIIEELQLAYNILQTIMGISKIQPFLERPNENLFGMASYYNIIRKPMWLLEVQRKLLSREYEDISGLVADIRLILENCYRFWGPSHKFCRKALFIEHKLELKLTQLPEAIQEKCVDPQLAELVVVKTENDDELSVEEPPQDNSKNSVCVTLKKGFESKILNRVLEYDEPQDSEDIEEQKQKEAEMQFWESEHLVSEVHKDQIKAMWQLAEIGSFLKLTFEALNVEEITQYEVERMLLMPKESSTLATLMTSMLSPQVMRSQLDDKPVMPYSIWTSRLKKRIDYWLSVFYKSGDEVEAFSTCGVEPAFWSCVNLMNPLEENDFHEIPFYQRVWIFKSLCNHLMHSDKPIQDILLDEGNTKDLRPIRIGGDKIGNIYFRIPFFREIRVYKQARLPHKTFQVEKDDFLASIMESTNDVGFNEEDNEIEFLPTKTDCFMVADSIDSLAEFTQKLKDRKQLVLAKNFTKQLKLVKNERKSIEGLIALYSQWHEYQNRSQEYFDHILNLWRSTEKQPQVDDSRVNPENIMEESVELGKRRRKRNQKFDFLSLRGTDSSEESSDFESSDVSDWESTYKHKKKKKLDKKKRSKRASSEPRSDTSDDLSKHECSSGISIQEVLTLKTEDDEDIKPDIEVLNFQNENGSVISYDEEPRVHPEPTPLVINSIQQYRGNSPSSVSPSVSPASLPPEFIAAPVIKKEKDDVIYISSDEEKESLKPVVSVEAVRTKVNNGIPIPKVLPVVQVQVPIRTPSPQPSLVRTRNVPKPLPKSIQASVISQSITHVPQPVPMPIPQPKPVPQPIPQPMPLPQRIPASPRSNPMPMPIPAPAQTRQMPLPIPEPPMPQPIVEPPMPQPIASPQAPSRAAAWNSPKSALSSPRTRGLSPRLRSPLSSPIIRTPSPRSSPAPLRSAISPIRPARNSAVRNLFPQTPAVPTVEGVLEIGQKPDGSYGYHVRLPDGGIINMSRVEIDDIRRKNNGVLPVKIEVPLTKNKKF